MNQDLNPALNYMQNVLGLNSLVLPALQPDELKAGLPLVDPTGDQQVDSAVSESSSLTPENIAEGANQQRSSELKTSWNQLANGQSPLLFLSLVTDEKQSLRQPETKQLFKKMAKAMGINEPELKIIEGPVGCSSQDLHSRLGQASAQFGILFVADEENLPQLFSQYGCKERVASGKWIATIHPCKLLNQPDLKREAWQHLKMMMQEMASGC